MLGVWFCSFLFDLDCAYARNSHGDVEIPQDPAGYRESRGIQWIPWERGRERDPKKRFHGDREIPFPRMSGPVLAFHGILEVLEA